MSRKLTVVFCLIFVAGFLVFSTESQAMPNFARKYSADCSLCHVAIPKLNRYGYEFRLAGYRIPAEIGQKENDFNLADFFAARTQFQYAYQDHKAVTTAGDSKSNQLTFHELTLYPLTGAWGKNFASLAEVSMAPDDVFELENAYVRGVYGDENGWFQARIGIMHPWEGSGASDRPLGNTRPLFQKVHAVGSPFFLWNLDEMAVEMGYHSANTGTSVAARLSNGIIWKEDGSGKAEPAQGGALSKVADAPGKNDKNYQLFLNQFINDVSSASLYYYHGTIPFPDPNVNAVTTQDSFYRIAAYANYFVLPDKLDILAGYEFGNDSLDDTSVANASSVGDSFGYFGEVDYHATPALAFAARYDFDDPSKEIDHNDQTAFTISGNYYILHGMQFIGDFQHKKVEQAAGGETKDNTLTARLIFIW